MFKSFLILLISLFTSAPDVSYNFTCTHLIYLGDSTSIPIETKLYNQFSDGNYGDVIVDAGNGRSLYYPGDTRWL